MKFISKNILWIIAGLAAIGAAYIIWKTMQKKKGAPAVTTTTTTKTTTTPTKDGNVISINGGDTATKEIVNDSPYSVPFAMN
jgi:hypothetical protein